MTHEGVAHRRRTSGVVRAALGEGLGRAMAIYQEEIAVVA